MLQPSPTTDQPKKSRGLLPLLSGVLVVAAFAAALAFSVPASSKASMLSFQANAAWLKGIVVH